METGASMTVSSVREAVTTRVWPYVGIASRSVDSSPEPAAGAGVGPGVGGGVGDGEGLGDGSAAPARRPVGAAMTSRRRTAARPNLGGISITLVMRLTSVVV